MKPNKGITLIALVITIIIMLILVGVTLVSLGGENGLFSKVQLAKRKYEINEAKEKIELKITEIRLEKEGKSETLKKEDLPKINDDEIDVGKTEKFPVEVICQGYKFNIDENFNVIYIGEAKQTIVTYTTEPEGYTNQSYILVKIKVSNSNGIKKIKYPNDYENNCNGKNNVAIDYPVQNNGIYTFKITDTNNNEIQKDIVIDKIDKVNPEITDILFEDITANGFTIKVEAKDGDQTEESTKSGIEKYEYYIKAATDENYTKYESTDKKYIFSNLKPDTEYTIYVTVYDRATNSVTSETKTQQTKTMPKNIYIDAINGDDATGDGTENNPYKTFENIQNIVVQGFSYNIYLNDGTYEFTSTLLSLDSNKDISIIGKGKSTEISVREHSSNNMGYTLKFYKLIWNANSVSTNVFGSRIDIEFHNVVFYNMAPNANDYFLPKDHGATELTYATYTFDHCTLPTYSLNTISICVGGKFNFEYCYGGFESGWGTYDNDWLDETCNFITSTPQTDSEYRITDSNCTQEYGVYYGEYAWE